MHISPFDNGNKAIIDTDHDTVPLTYFNIVKLHEGERFTYRTPGYETCIVPATGGVNVDTDGEVLPGSAIAAVMSGMVSPKAFISPAVPKQC